MVKLIKWVFGLVVVLAALIMIAAVVLPMVINPNDYKGEIISLVKEKTGRNLQIDKKLSLSVFPWLGIRAGGVTLSNAPGFGDKPFAQIRELQLRVKLLPLFSRRIEVDTLDLDGLRLNLQRNKQGQTNWASLAGSAKKAAATEEAPSASSQSASGAPVAFQVKGVRIEDAQLSWQDAQTGQHYTLKNFHLVSGLLEPGTAVPLSGGFEFDSSKPQRALTLSLKANVEADETFQKVSVNDLALNLEATGDGLPAAGLKLALSGQVAADLAKGDVTVDNLKLSGPVQLTGNLAIAGLNAKPRIQGQLQLQQSNLKTLASIFGVDIETADPAALTSVGATIKVAQSGHSIDLDPIQVSLDNTNITGAVHVLDTKGPVVKANFNIDSLDLDNYLPPPNQPVAAQPQAQPAAAAGSGPGDQFAALRTLDLNAQLTIGKLVVSKMHLQNVVVKAVGQKGVLQLSPVSADLYSGKLAGKITFDVRQSVPKATVAESLTGIQIGPLLTDVIGQDKLVGTGNVNVNLGVTGIAAQQIRNSLTGTASFKFLNGAYKGVNLAQLIRGAGNALGISEKLPADNSNQTDFTEMGGSITANNGVISNRDLQAMSPLLRVNGQGTVDLPANSIDYVLTTTLVNSLQGQGGKAVGDLSGLPIPVKISGSLDNPSYRPDLESVLKAKAKQKIEQEATKALGGQLPGKLLKGLFGN